MIVMLLTEHNLEFLSLKGGCRSSSESTLVKMPHCWKSHVMAQMCCSMYTDTYCEQYSSPIPVDPDTVFVKTGIQVASKYFYGCAT